MCGHIKMDRIKNEVVHDKVSVAPVTEKIREVRLRWFCHMRRRSVDALVRRYERLVVLGLPRGRGRPKKNWAEVIRNDMTQI